MCKSGRKQAAYDAAAAAAAPKTEAVTAAPDAPAAPNAAIVSAGISGTEADAKEVSAAAKKKGRSALRIDLGAGNAGGPVGLNVPQG